MTDIPLYRGSDLDFRVTLPTGELDPGWTTVEVYDAHPSLDGLISVSMGVGEITGRIAWSESLPVGSTMGFRLRFSDGVSYQSTRSIGVYIK